jgi:SAM-dependent methyltransferase
MIKCPQKWDSEYGNGLLSYYHDIEEAARHAALFGLLTALGCSDSILEIGCGDGASLKYIPPATLLYVGVDVSDVAVQRARAVARPDSRFMVRDAETWVPAERYTAIVFNECLNYFSEPLTTFSRYFRFLQRGGVLAASIWHGNHGITNRLSDKVCVLHRSDIENERGVWTLLFTKGMKP